jgi:hypothetical protein
VKLLETILVLIFIGISTPVLRAAGGLSIEQGIPLEMSDADVEPPHACEFHLFGRYENSSEEGDFWSLVSRLRYGFARHWEVRVELPLETGSATANGIGNLKIQATYQLLNEEELIPAASIFGALSLPTGKGSQGWDPTLGILVTKGLPFTPWDDRLHLNFGFHHDAKAGDQRDNRTKILIGYDVKLTPNTVLLADLVWDEEADREIDSSVAEIGVRTSINSNTAVGAGIGVGLNDESPNIRLTLGLQRSFYTI